MIRLCTYSLLFWCVVNPSRTHQTLSFITTTCGSTTWRSCWDWGDVRQRRFTLATTGIYVRRIMPYAVSIVDRISSLSIDIRDGTAYYAFRLQVSASPHRARPSRRCTVTAVARIEASLYGAWKINLSSEIIKSWRRCNRPPHWII